MTSPPRVYFDGNDADEAGNYLLCLDRSKVELAKIPGGPVAGLLLTIYMIGEIEMEAHLKWNASWKSWVACPILSTVRENHETWD